MAIWKVHRDGAYATLVYVNTVDDRIYNCGTVSDVDTQTLIDWTVQEAGVCFGLDIFVDGQRVYVFLARPLGRAS